MVQSQTTASAPPRNSTSSSERKQQLDAWRRQRHEQQQQQRKPPPFRPASVRPRAASVSINSSSSILRPPAARRRASMAAKPSPPPSAASSSSTGRSSPNDSRSPPSPTSSSPQSTVRDAPVSESSVSLPPPLEATGERAAVGGEARAFASRAQSVEESTETFVVKHITLENEIVTESLQESEPNPLGRRNREEDTRDERSDALGDAAARALERSLMREFDAERTQSGEHAALTATVLKSEQVTSTLTQEQHYADQVDNEQALAMLLEQVSASQAVRESDAPSNVDGWVRDDRTLQNDDEEMARRDSGEMKMVDAPIVFSAAAMVAASTVMEVSEETAFASSAVKHLACDPCDQSSDREQRFEVAAAHAGKSPSAVPGAHQQRGELEEYQQVSEAEHKGLRRRAQGQARRLAKAILAGVTGLSAIALLLCTAVCWSSPAPQHFPATQTLTHQAAATCRAVPTAIKKAFAELDAWWAGIWGRLNARHHLEAGQKPGIIELAASSLSKAKTICSNCSESLQRHSLYYLTSMLNGLRSAASRSTQALGSVWKSVFPSSREADLIEVTRAQLLDPFEADQRALNEKLKALMRKQEAWALEELQRMKQRRALHASTTESILTSTRALVIDALQEAKVIAEHHVESYTETVSGQLLQSIQREIAEHEQRVNEELQQATRTAVAQETESLENTARHELETLEQQKLEEEQALDLELSAEKNHIATAKEALVRELAAMAAREKSKIEAEYERVSAEVASKLEQVEHELFDVNFENVESQVAGIATQAKTELEEEDAKLLAELKELEELAAARVIVEQERALADVAEVAKQQEEKLRHERQVAEELARALAEEEERVAAERRYAEEKIAKAAQRDLVRLEEERQKAEAELLVVRQQEEQRIQIEEQKAEEELARIKQEEEASARREREKADATIAEAARAEALRVQHEQELLEARVAQQAAAEQERLRVERAVAEKALERALEEEREELLAQLEEGEELVQQAVADDGVNVPEAVAALPVVVELPPSEQRDVSLAPEVESIATMVPPMPKVELLNPRVVSALFLVLAAVTAWFLSTQYRRLAARRRQRTRAALNARRKRWQRVAESSDSDSAEEVVLLARAASRTGNEPEPEALGSPCLSETATRSAAENLREASSTEEQDESSALGQVGALPDTVEARDEAVVSTSAPAPLSDASCEADADGEYEEENSMAAPRVAQRPATPPHAVVRHRALRVTRTTTTTTTVVGRETE